MPKLFWQYTPTMRAIDYFWVHAFFVYYQIVPREEKRGELAAKKLSGNIASFSGVRIPSPAPFGKTKIFF